MREPSGENDGRRRTTPSSPVELRRLAAVRRRRRRAGRSARCPSARRAATAKTIRLPSGDHAGLAVLAVAVGELPRLAAVEVDDEDVLAAVGRPADAVELVEEARAAGAASACCSSSSSYASSRTRARRRAASSRATRRPLDALLAVGELARLAALGGDDVELRRRLVVAAVRDEREPAAVRRPARRRRRALARGELPRLAGAVERRDPDRAAVLVRLLVDRPDLSTRRAARPARCAGRRRRSARRRPRAAFRPRGGTIRARALCWSGPRVWRNW